ncbi:MAG: tRNA isopentenyl-2-thiomethyl-A-37 hydroxylase MiaE [Planctomycetota bacterium]|jgi:tRNA-(ms[2]io[6]A)-hydroxylase
MLGLQSRTDPAWAQAALSDEIALLRDHAHLERKAAGHMISLMGQLPRGGERLLDLAREELEHFERVCRLLAARGAELGPDPGNPYVQQLVKASGKTLLDRILRMGIIEARSYEHFCLLAETAQGDVQALFHGLKDSEAGHHAFFSKLAHEHWPRAEVQARWEALAQAEATIVADLPWGPRVH